jgi:hypothetical protein
MFADDGERDSAMQLLDSRKHDLVLAARLASR